MATNGNGLPTWKKFAAFEVFGDYVPTRGARVLVRVSAQTEQLHTALQRRAAQQAVLDPELGCAVLRAGLGLLRTDLVSFAYATVEEVIVVLRPEAIEADGASLAVHNRIVSEYASLLSVLIGHPIGATAQIFEVPDISVVRRGLAALAEDVEEATPMRSAMWLGAQLEGRGEPFHPSMVETLEEQSHLLQRNGIDMDALPAWWWRGMAATRADVGIEIFNELPSGEEFGTLVAE